MSASQRGHSSSATSTGSFTAVAALGRLLGNLSWNSDDPKSDYDSFQDRFDGIVRTVEGGLEAQFLVARGSCRRRTGA